MDLYTKILNRGFKPYVIKLTNGEVRINRLLTFFGRDPKYKESVAKSVLVSNKWKVYFDDMGYVDMTDPSGCEYQFGKRFDDDDLLKLFDNGFKMENRSKVISKILSNHG